MNAKFSKNLAKIGNHWPPKGPKNSTDPVINKEKLSMVRQQFSKGSRYPIITYARGGNKFVGEMSIREHPHMTSDFRVDMKVGQASSDFLKLSD